LYVAKEKRKGPSGRWSFFGFGSTSILSGWDKSPAFLRNGLCAWNEGFAGGLVTKGLDRFSQILRFARMTSWLGWV
jgi:hypothetical protein